MIQFVEYKLSLEAPAIIHGLGGDPNSATTMRFIPGGMIRGAVAGILGDPDLDPQIQPLFQSLILSGRVRYLNAYPFRSELRSLPSPVCFRVEKGVGGNDLEVTDLSGYEAGDSPDVVLKRFPDLFFELTTNPSRVKVNTGICFHHQRDRQKGRAWQEKKGSATIPHGTVFSYEYLREGQDFAGMIAIEGTNEKEIGATIEDLRKTAAKRPEILLGRSRRAQYGGAAGLRINSEQLYARETKRTSALLSGPLTMGTSFRVLLTSAAIVRDQDTGQTDPVAIGRVLLEKLGNRAEVEEVWLDFDVIAGYNRKWGLPMVQSHALKAGCILRCKATQDIPEADWIAVETAGIGERRSEGMGALVFLPGHTAKTLTVRDSATTKRNLQQPAKISPLVRQMQKEILRKELGRIATEQAFALAAKADCIPAGSLLGRLRLPLRDGSNTPLKTLATWLGKSDQALKKPAIKQLHRCRLAGGCLFEWLSETVTKTAVQALHEFQLEKIWSDFTMSDPAFAKTCGEELLEDIRVLFIDAVLAGLARKKREGKGA